MLKKLRKRVKKKINIKKTSHYQNKHKMIFGLYVTWDQEFSGFLCYLRLSQKEYRRSPLFAFVISSAFNLDCVITTKSKFCHLPSKPML